MSIWRHISAKADRTLELRFILPSAYPAAPPQVKARLLSEKLSAKAVEDHGDSPLAGERATELVVVVEEEEGNEESPQSAQENESITALLQEQVRICARAAVRTVTHRPPRIGAGQQGRHRVATLGDCTPVVRPTPPPPHTHTFHPLLPLLTTGPYSG